MIDIEEFERLKNNIFSINSDKAIKTILIYSSVRGEGCSTVAFNLAKVMAEKPSSKICLIDRNFVNPTLHKLFDLKKINGSQALFSDNQDLSKAIKKTEFPNLFFMSCEKKSGYFAEGSEPDKLDVDIEELKENFDHIIFDSSPINTDPETQTIVNKVDGVILVIHSGNTRWEVVKRAKEQLEMNNAKILGVVLNKKRGAIPNFIYKRLK